MVPEPWQLQLIKRSIKKRDKLRLIQRSLDFDPERKALDLGCAQGILSIFVRQKGGFWVSTDEDMANLKTARSLLEENLLLTRGDALPFKNEAFDLVLCLDYLEHVDDDERTLLEIERVLKPRGELILVTPHTGRFFFLHKLRRAIGLKLEDFGHKREGYERKDLEAMLCKAGLNPEKYRTYSRFFSEFIELLLNFFYLRLLSSPPKEKLRDGHIRPATEEEFTSHRKAFRLYSFIAPLLWVFSRFDVLLFFQKGYSLIIWAKKTPSPRS